MLNSIEGYDSALLCIKTLNNVKTTSELSTLKFLGYSMKF